MPCVVVDGNFFIFEKHYYGRYESAFIHGTQLATNRYASIKISILIQNMPIIVLMTN